MITEEDILIVAPDNCTAAAKIDIIIAFHFIITKDSTNCWSGFSKRCLFRVWTARRPSLPVRNTPRPSQAPDPSGENTLQSSSSSSSWFSMILQVQLLETHTVSNFQEKQYSKTHIELISDPANEDSD